MEESVFLVRAIRHSVSEWRCDQSRRVQSMLGALGTPLCLRMAVPNQSNSSISCLLARKGVGSKLRIGSLDLKMRGAARLSRSNSHEKPYISTGRSPTIGPFPLDCRWLTVGIRLQYAQDLYGRGPCVWVADFTVCPGLPENPRRSSRRTRKHHQPSFYPNQRGAL